MKAPRSFSFAVIGVCCWLAAHFVAAQQPAAPSAAERLPTLQAQFDNRIRAEVDEPFQKGLAELNTKYAQALNQAFQDAQRAGNLPETLVAKEELLRVTKNDPLPKEDPADYPANLKRLRTAYRQSFDLIATRRAEGLAKWQAVYVGELQKIMAELTQQGKLDVAVAVQERIKSLGMPVVATTTAGSAASTPGVAEPTGMAKGSDPALARATKEQPFVNSLGMKFVPVTGTEVLFCIHEVRYKDYAAYAAETPGGNALWKNQSADGFILVERPEDHPVTNVSWEEAKAYCDWLSKKEGKTYRLPTDREWSIAVGIGREEKWTKDTTPETVFKVKDAFPWGDRWPLPKGAGNYSDQSRKGKAPGSNTSYLDDYDDGHPTTAPVMSFAPNKFGIYDLGGNVWEWCEDLFSNQKTTRVLRGGSWYGDGRVAIASSYRFNSAPNFRRNNDGFRIVVETGSR